MERQTWFRSAGVPPAGFVLKTHKFKPAGETPAPQNLRLTMSFASGPAFEFRVAHPCVFKGACFLIRDSFLPLADCGEPFILCGFF
jgi:hypothetical protein